MVVRFLQTAPQHVEYDLTELGKSLQQPLTAICEWAAAATPVAD
jgi:DNA-binding HxlR family transcriptional regulator